MATTPNPTTKVGVEKARSSASTVALAFTAFSLACGGPVGIESSVQTGGPLLTIVFLAVASLLWALPQALLSAELSTRIPTSGGSIDWVYRLLGPVAGVCNAVALTFNQAFDLPLYPLLFTGALQQVLPPMSNGGIVTLQLSVIAVSAAVNIVGVDAVLTSATALTCFILAPFLLLPVVAAGYRLPFRWEALSAAQTPSNFTSQWGVFVAGVLWNLQGWTGIGNLAEEVTNVAVLPRGLVLGVALAFVSYTYAVVFGAVIDPVVWTPGVAVADWSSWDDGHLVDVASSVRGWFGIVAGIAAGIAALSTSISSLASNARTLQATAAAGVLPIPYLDRDWTRWRTPVPAILLLSATSAGLVFVDLTNLLQLDTMFANLSVAIVVTGFAALRARDAGVAPWLSRLLHHSTADALTLPPGGSADGSGPPAQFRIPGGPWFALALSAVLWLFVVFSFVVVASGLWWAAVAPAVTLAAVAAIVWWVRRRRLGGRQRVPTHDGESVTASARRGGDGVSLARTNSGGVVRMGVPPPLAHVGVADDAAGPDGDGGVVDSSSPLLASINGRGAPTTRTAGTGL